MDRPRTHTTSRTEMVRRGRATLMRYDQFIEHRSKLSKQCVLRPGALHLLLLIRSSNSPLTSTWGPLFQNEAQFQGPGISLVCAARRRLPY
eukprot:7558980-Pyramimonas_sp.AAC.1